MRPFQGALLGRPLPGPREEEGPASLAGAEMAAILLGLIILMLLLLLLLFILACRPWRFFSSRPAPIQADDIERPLFSENLDYVSGRNYDVARKFAEESSIQIDENRSSLRTHDFHANQGSSLVVDAVSDTIVDHQVGQTLKRTTVLSRAIEDAKHARREDVNSDVDIVDDDGRCQVSAAKDIASLRSSLTLEVIAGPSRGLCCSRQSKDSSMLPLTLGRVSPSDLLLKDSEVSGKHAFINWNINKSKWELVDMGSLNGTFLNSQAVNYQDSGSRHWSEPVELASGDVITLGSSSKVSVQIMQHFERQIPCGVGMASDPMSLRHGGKRLPMEDMCFCQWPLPGVKQFGLFGIFDGHGGAGAAKAACKLLPANITNILANPEKRERVISLCDASDVLRHAFSLTEDAMNHQYEGCTATVLLVWFDHNKDIFAQCANVGDSACFLSVNGKSISMSEDHRITSLPERTRLIKSGKPLKDGETRLYEEMVEFEDSDIACICSHTGLNIGRMLGDKFLKEQDDRFSSEPFVSQVVHITKACTAFALLASDGLWDVISIKKAAQLVLQRKERDDAHDKNLAEKIAKYVLGEARSLRTKDNTSVIFLDLDIVRMDSCILNS